MGSLSHYINTRAAGYHDLPLFPEKAPSTTVRNVPEPVVVPVVETPASNKTQPKKKKSFYSESDSSPPDGNELKLYYLCMIYACIFIMLFLIVNISLNQKLLVLLIVHTSLKLSLNLSTFIFFISFIIISNSAC